MKIKLGGMYRDKITGFVGVVTAVTSYLGGDKQVSLQSPHLNDGVPLPVQYMDSKRLEPTKDTAHVPESEEDK